jgi:hypothetical protein
MEQRMQVAEQWEVYWHQQQGEETAKKAMQPQPQKPPPK